MVNVREAKLGDETLVLEYIKKLARYENLESEVSGTAIDVIDNIFNKNVAKALLFTNESGHYIGFSLYFLNFSTFQVKPGLYIEDIYIDEDMRGYGYGTYIFEYYQKLAKQLGCGRLEWICLDWNTDAIDFYEQKLKAKTMNGWTIRRIEIQ